MRILHVIPAFPPAQGYGGGPRVAFELSSRMALRGHDMLVITTDAAAHGSRLPSGQREEAGVKIYSVRNMSNVLAYNYKIFLAPALIRDVPKILRGVDVIHMHDLRTLLNAVTYMSSIHRVPYVLQVHGVLSTRGRLRLLKTLFDLLFGRRLVRDASKLLALNETESEAYTEMGAKRHDTIIVPNAIDLHEFEALPSRGMIRQRYHLEDAPLILFLGRIHLSKGLNLLIRAFQILSSKMPDARLLIVGPDDGYLPQLKREATALGLERRIIFAGFLAGKEKLAAYVDADVFATPQFFGFPLTFLEAAACGLPIVATDAGHTLPGIDGKVGAVTTANAVEYAEALYEILTNDRLYETYREGAFHFARRHDWEVVVDILESIYEEVCESVV